uniref:Wntless-like transmembrane domain-containing protein n=1 Tax=Arcella intermedia TaxID=1963864 RepID=A0A6B2L3Y4_9EUKA
MNLHTMSGRGFLLTFALFLGLFCGSIVVGFFFGPPVIITTSQTANLALNWTGAITDLSPLHQQLILTMYIHKEVFQYNIDVKEKLTLSISVDGSQDGHSWIPLESQLVHSKDIQCDAGKEICDGVIIAYEPHIKWGSYRYKVDVVSFEGPVAFVSNTTFSFSYVNDSFTLFELWCRFGYLFCSFLVLVNFIFKLRNYNWRDWSVEQKWTCVLLFGTFAFNDPFCGLSILISGWFPVLLDVILFGSFLVLLLFFWLVMFDGMRQEDTKHSFVRFYLPKFLIIGLIWVSLVVGSTLFALKELDDPAAIIEVQGYIIFFQSAMFLLLIGYSFWLVYLVFRACGMINTMPFLNVRLKFFGLFTLFVFMVTTTGILFGIFSPLPVNAAQFVAFLSLLNFYVYTLSFVYLPSGGLLNEDMSQRIGVTALENDEDDFPLQDKSEPEGIPVTYDEKLEDLDEH